MAWKVLDESEITAEGRRLRAELVAEGDEILDERRRQRAREELLAPPAG